MLKTPQSSNPAKVTFMNLVNTPLRQADIDERESRLDDRNGGVMLSLVKKVNPFRNLRDDEEYRPEKLIFNSRRLHYQFHKQLTKCQHEPVVDATEFEFSNIQSIFNFMRKNSNSNCDLQGVNQPTLLADTEKYGLDEYLQLQQSQNLHLYDRLTLRRYAVEKDNMERFHRWKLINQERIGTVSISPHINVVMKRISEMNADQHLEFVAGLHQRLHNCFKLAKREYYQLVDENMAARNSELKSEIEHLKVIDNTIQAELKKKEDKYKKLQKKMKDLQKLEKYAKELRQKLNKADQKIIDAKNRQTQLRESNKQLLQKKELLEVKLKECREVKRANNDWRNSRLLLNRSVGCTELFPVPIKLSFPPSSTSSPYNQNDCRFGGGNNFNNSNKNGNAMGDIHDSTFKEEIMNLLSPSRITLKSSKNHVYELTTLLGLVNFILTCQVCDIPSPPPSSLHTINHVSDGQNGDEQNLLSLKHLKVTKLQVASPDDDDCPVECSAVESVARVCIDYLSTQGSDQLRNLCIGLTLDRAIKQIQFIIAPYMVLAGDLRALWLARYDVAFSLISLNDHLFSSMCVTPKSLRKLIEQTPRSTLHRSQVLHSSRRTPFQQQRQQQYYQSLTSGIDSSTSEVPKSLAIFQPITPPGPYSITVTTSTRRFRLRVCFTLFSLDFFTPDDQASVEFENMRGNVCCEKLNDHFKTCKPMSGHLSTIMSEIKSFLSA
uniref:Uncharacterized protein n=1 Tax=Trichobilharzia regenti TaxID=157069 RepID=A0AA85KLW7_TRIRE|nr:unnamed protein product [Trichobilharzia regenti]CAH8853318.1 unnamed protein product [Trichobilharzia regenti]